MCLGALPRSTQNAVFRTRVPHARWHATGYWHQAYMDLDLDHMPDAIRHMHLRIEGICTDDLCFIAYRRKILFEDKNQKLRD